MFELDFAALIFVDYEDLAKRIEYPFKTGC